MLAITKDFSNWSSLWCVRVLSIDSPALVSGAGNLSARTSSTFSLSLPCRHLKTGHRRFVLAWHSEKIR